MMPLALIILILFVIITFVIGVSLLSQGYSILPDAKKMVSAGALEKAQADLKLAVSETGKLRVQANTLAVQMDETKNKLAWAENNQKSLEEMLKQGSQAQARIGQLEKDLSFLSQKADAQAREAIDVIMRLAAESESLQRGLPDQGAAANTGDLNRLVDENQKLKIQMEGYASKVKDLEAVVQPASEAAGKLAEIGKASSALSDENAVLKKNFIELEAKIKTAQAETERMKGEYAQSLLELQNRIAGLDAENKILRSRPAAAASSGAEEEIKKIRQQNEERIVQANAAIVKLNSDLELFTAEIAGKEARIKKLVEELSVSRQEAAGFLRELGALKASSQAVNGELPESISEVADKDKKNLQKRLEELQVVNQLLRDKEKILTYKLAQSRAQAMGLEKICEEFKFQVEGR